MRKTHTYAETLLVVNPKFGVMSCRLSGNNPGSRASGTVGEVRAPPLEEVDPLHPLGPPSCLVIHPLGEAESREVASEGFFTSPALPPTLCA